jgi:hypothetical protein
MMMKMGMMNPRKRVLGGRRNGKIKMSRSVKGNQRVIRNESDSDRCNCKIIKSVRTQGDLVMRLVQGNV